jgi:hypothetical protein
MKHGPLAGFLITVALLSACAHTPQRTIQPPILTPAATLSASATLAIPTPTASPEPLPEGTYIAFLEDQDPPGELYNLAVVSEDGLLRAELIEAVGYAPSISTDGVSVADPRGRALVIHGLGAEGARSFQLPFAAHWASWSPNGDSILVSSPDIVALYSTSTGETRTIVDCSESDLGPHFSCGRAIWSSDGKFIALAMTLERDGPPDPRNGTYIIDATCVDTHSHCLGSAQGPFPDSGAYAWSPDSRLLALCDESVLPGLLIFIETMSWKSREVGLCGSAYSLAWHPDGSRIAIGTYGSIQLFDVTTSEWSTLLRDESIQNIAFWTRLPIPR